MTKLISDLLALSRLGRVQVRKSVVNLTAMTSQIFKLLKEEDPDRDLRIIIDDLPPALGDHSLLSQVMQNLLSNAAKFTKSKADCGNRGGWPDRGQ